MDRMSQEQQPLQEPSRPELPSSPAHDALRDRYGMPLVLGSGVIGTWRGTGEIYPTADNAMGLEFNVSGGNFPDGAWISMRLSPLDAENLRYTVSAALRRYRRELRRAAQRPMSSGTPSAAVDLPSASRSSP